MQVWNLYSISYSTELTVTKGSYLNGVYNWSYTNSCYKSMNGETEFGAQYSEQHTAEHFMSERFFLYFDILFCVYLDDNVSLGLL